MSDLFRMQQRKVFNDLEKRFDQGESPASIIESIEDYNKDERLCLTTVIFLPKDISQLLTEKIILPLKKADPRQHFYAPESLHTTILTIRDFAEPKMFPQSEITSITDTFHKVIGKHSRVSYSFQELLELTTSLGVRGYTTENLIPLVQSLRSELKKQGTPDNRKLISDEIYFGHVTVCRFTTPPNQKFLKKVQELKDTKIGEFTLSEVSLVKSKISFLEKDREIISHHSLLQD